MDSSAKNNYSDQAYAEHLAMFVQLHVPRCHLLRFTKSKMRSDAETANIPIKLLIVIYRAPLFQYVWTAGTS